MTNYELFEKLMSGEIDNLHLMNEEGLDFLQLILNKAMLGHFKITINNKYGKTLFEKIKHE